MHLDLDYRAWRYRLKVERAEIRFVLDALGPGDVAIDVGAHKGAFTYWMQRRVGPSGRVIAVEPQPALAARLAEIARDRRWHHVRVEACALSDAPGRLPLYVPEGGPSPGASLSLPRGAPVEVPVSTLDALVAPGTPVRLIKCDVEGHEARVFAGGARVLAEARPALLFECEARHHPEGRLEGVFEGLEALGYEGFFFWDGRLRPRRELVIAEHQDPARRPYANNFVFKARR